jgi:hypothetical protein
MIPSLILLLIPLWERPTIIYFGLLMLPCFMINAYYTSKNQDRAIMNDLSAILAFSIAGLASSYLAHAEINIQTIVFPFLTSVLFFVGCTFYVKTMIREKKNNHFKFISWIYHILLVLVCFGLGNWIIALAFVPSLLRAVTFYGKTFSPKQIGIYEIVNSALFFVIVAIQIILAT